MTQALENVIKSIVSESSKLKNKFTDQQNALVEFACVFCQTDEEYIKYTNVIKTAGKVVQETPTGYTYLLSKPVQTVAGPLKLFKIRKPDSARKEYGDADFNTNYLEFKKKYFRNARFELIKRGDFEMLRLSDPEFNVMACFSNIPLGKSLGLI